MPLASLAPHLRAHVPPELYYGTMELRDALSGDLPPDLLDLLCGYRRGGVRTLYRREPNRYVRCGRPVGHAGPCEVR